MSFSSLGLSAELLRAVSDNGYTTPTPIQLQAIPVILEGRDVLPGFQIRLIEILEHLDRLNSRKE